MDVGSHLYGNNCVPGICAILNPVTMSPCLFISRQWHSAARRRAELYSAHLCGMIIPAPSELPKPFSKRLGTKNSLGFSQDWRLFSACPKALGRVRGYSHPASVLGKHQIRGAVLPLRTSRLHFADCRQSAWLLAAP